MRHSPLNPYAVAVIAALALALAPVPGAAQEGAQAPAPQPQMSDDASSLLDEAIDGTHREDLELKQRPNFFPSLEGGTFSMIAFETSTDGLQFTAGEATAEGSTPPATAELEAFAAVIRDGEEIGRFGGPFTIEEGSGSDGFSSTHSFGVTIDPGSYELVWGVRDLNAGVATTRRETLEVPAFGADELKLTTVLVSSGVDQTQEPMMAGAVYPGVRVASLLVQDDIDRTFEVDEQVELIYIVMGAQADPEAGTQKLECSYRILDMEGTSMVRFPPQELNRITVGQPIPFARIENVEPGGEYQFEILVKDLVAGTETERMVPFRMAGEPEAEEAEQQ